MENDRKLLLSVLARYITVFIVLGLLFFLTAGTIAFINGWIYIVTLVLLMGAGFIVLYRKDKKLLEKRVRTREKEKQQILFVIISSVLVTALYAIPGLDYRFCWSTVPVWLQILGEVLLIAGYVMNIVVMLQNSYASRVIEIQEEQKLIDTGMYKVVRHPMYMSMSLLYIGTPLILGSFIGLIPGMLFPFTLVMRIMNEEKVLKEGLPGYGDYMMRVRYRLIPFIW